MEKNCDTEHSSFNIATYRLVSST
jgi:hypothetical protein